MPPSSLFLSFVPNSTLGALLVGVLVSTMLFGLLSHQVYIYVSRFPNDAVKVKGLVAVVWLCELAHVICISHTLYILTISDYGRPERIHSLPLSIDASTVFNAIVAVCVQGFFSYRIYRLSKGLLIPFLSWTLSFLFLVATLTVFGICLTLVPFATFEQRWGWLLDTMWSLAAANDLLIAVTLAVHFWAWRREEPSHQTIALVDKLIAWTIETGIVTSAAAILNLICFIVMKTNFIWIAWYVITARLYSNSFLASLNSRETLRMMTDMPQQRQWMTRTPSHNLECRCTCDRDRDYPFQTDVQSKEGKMTSNDMHFHASAYPSTNENDDHSYSYSFGVQTRTREPALRDSGETFVDLRGRPPAPRPENPMLRSLPGGLYSQG
ncbi:hypothetical protein C8F01DRAFT_1125650 [Mycena amicta]|nr:hypothetical protein C8F01DRAFT_1125650 [Mycena amicta]